VQYLALIRPLPSFYKTNVNMVSELDMTTLTRMKVNDQYERFRGVKAGG
jgi:hypothetical protein